MGSPWTCTTFIQTCLWYPYFVHGIWLWDSKLMEFNSSCSEQVLKAFSTCEDYNQVILSWAFH